MYDNPYGVPNPPAMNTGPRIGDWLSEAFNLFGKEWKTWVLQGLATLAIVAAVQFLVIGIAMIPMGAAFFRAMASPNSTTSPGDVAAILGFYGAIYGSAFLAMFPAYFLMTGMLRTAAKQLRGEPIAVGDLFSGGDVYWQVLGASILAGLAASVGMLLCVVPGLLIASLLFYTHPLIVERRLGVTDAMRMSWEAVKPHLWMNLVWIMLIYIIINVGSAIGCGFIATMPIGILMWMIGYRDTLGLPGALPPGAAAQATPPPVYGVNYGAAGPPTAAGACPACGRAVAYGAVVCPSCNTPLG
jgi:uncharacterized membrane protein